MKKLKTLLLMLCLLLSAAFCNANGAINLVEEGAPITIIKGTNYGGPDRSDSMLANINGHTLTIAFTENLGEVSIEVQNGDGVPVDLSIMDTPTGFMTYIPLAGRYTLIIKLEDGDEYFGEFEVDD